MAAEEVHGRELRALAANFARALGEGQFKLVALLNSPSLFRQCHFFGRNVIMPQIAKKQS